MPNCTLKYLVQLCNEEKLFLNQPAVSQLHVPAWEELAVKYVWHDAMKHHNFKDYLPDHWKPTNHQVDRAFFYAVLSTVCPQYVNDLIDDCREQRKQRRQRPAAAASIRRIQPAMMRLLLKHDFVPSKYPHLSFLILLICSSAGPKRGPSSLITRQIRKERQQPVPKPKIVHQVRMRGILNKYYKDENQEPVEESDAEKLKRQQKELEKLTLTQLKLQLDAGEEIVFDRVNLNAEAIPPLHSTTQPSYTTGD